MLADLETDRLTWRRVSVLLAHLPRESAYFQRRSGDVGMWGPVEHLLADVVDVLSHTAWMYANVHRDPNKPEPKRPRPRRRPGMRDDDPPADAKMVRPGELARMMRRGGGR